MRYLSWYSCGAASAVATKLALASGKPIEIIYCEVKNEHPDNARFLTDCEDWFGQKIQIMGRDDLGRDINGAFAKAKYLSGVGGAPCTRMLKKQIREDVQRPTDCHIFGYTADKADVTRYDRFIDANADVAAWPILIEKGLTHADCLAMVRQAGIELPEMYNLGYLHNNCIGCVKSTGVRYWAKVRHDFPEIYEERSKAEDLYNASICKIDMGTVAKRYPDIYADLNSPEIEGPNGEKRYWRPRLAELPLDIPPSDDSPDIQCSMFCMIAESEYE